MTMGPQGTLQADILIENGKIVDIAEKITAEGAEIIDASGLLVLPGLVDAHSHIGGFDTDTGAQDLNELTKPQTPEIQAYDGINPLDRSFMESAKAGITTSAITPGSGNVIGGVVCAVKSAGQGTVESMCVNRHVALKAAMGGNPKGVYGKRNQMPMTRMGVASVLRQYFRDVQEYMKKQEEAQNDPAKMPKWDPGVQNNMAVAVKYTVPVTFRLQ